MPMEAGKRATLTTLALFASQGLAWAETPIKATKQEFSAFVKADKDQSITLNKREFRIFVDAMADSGQSTAKKIRFFSAYSFAFNRADLNGDGMITPHELRAADSDYRKNGK